VFDIDTIALTLGELPAPPHEPVSGDTWRRMVQGYGYVDHLLASGQDPFVYKGSRLLLEMNHLVLCGTSPERRAEFARHIEATELRFYGDHWSGADAFYSWAAQARHLAPSGYAARSFYHIVSTPQLFIEGNRRTATLLASYVLGRTGSPPLVIDTETFPTYSSLCADCKAVDRRRLAAGVREWFLVKRLQRLITRSGNIRFLASRATKLDKTRV